jgi:hypothetical protein
MVRWAGAAVPAAASCAAVAVLAAASMAGCGSRAPAAGASASVSASASASASRQDPVAACGKPSTSFARFWFLTEEPDPGVYQGTVLVGSARVPALSMYVSGGPPGAGTLCVSAQAGWPGPVQATAAPRQGPIAYVGTAGSPQDTVYFATRPGVARVTMNATGASFVYAYTVDGPDQCTIGSTVCQLEPLGSGWHAAGSGFGIMAPSVALRAYNAAGHLMETVTEPLTAPTPSQPAAPATPT